MAEQNALHAYRIARELQGAEIAYGMIAELTLNSQSTPTSIQEGGVRYQIVRVPYDAESPEGCRTGYQVGIVAGTNLVADGQVPVCDDRLFSH